MEEAEITSNVKVLAWKYGAKPKIVRYWRKDKLKIKYNIANVRSDSKDCKWQVGKNRFPKRCCWLPR